MDKLTCWTMAIILLCWWCWPLYGNNSRPQYSSVRIWTDDTSQIIYLALHVMVLEIGKKLDNKYICPVYCDVDHKHYFREKDEEKHEQEGNIQTVDGIHSTVGAASKEQSAGSL